MSELAQAAEALAAGRRDDALVHARNAVRDARRRDLPELARLAAELDDTALIVAVLVRRFHTRRWRMWRVGETIGLAFFLMLAVALYFGFPLLVALALISNRVVAVIVAIVAAPLLMVGAAKGWVRFDD